MLWSMLTAVGRIALLVPGFLAGVLFALALVMGGVGAYVWFVCCGPPRGIPDCEVEKEIRAKLVKEWESPASAEHLEAYRCGWVCLATEYSERPPIDMTVLLKMKNASRKSRPPNVFFLVLKHNSLFLYEGEEQTQCAGVAVMEGCKIDLYPHTLLLDEIYKKEFPLRIVSDAEVLFEGKSKVYLYAANASEKEDWLFVLRQAAQPVAAPAVLPGSASYLPQDDPKLADAIFMERLNRYVRAGPPTLDKENQWINAIAGRLFFNIFRSSDLERIIRKKFERKAATAPKPFFIGDVVLKEVWAGQSLPMFSRGQLHSMTNAGELLVSVDLFYAGGFRMQIETEIRWDIPRVKTLIVPVVMSIHVRRFSGRALVRIKPPPSDRLWVGFYAPPQIDIDIEPVVSSTAITWSVIKTGIMKHIQDTMAEYLVLPNMDDFNVPPVIIGDCYGGEKPFELDYIPPTVINEARQQDLSAHGISAMQPSRGAEAELMLYKAKGSLLDRGPVAGSHSLSDLSLDVDLAMEELTAYSTPSTATNRSDQLLNEARKSDALARERTTGPSGVDFPSQDSSGQASNASSPARTTTTKEVITNVRKSVSTFFKTRQVPFMRNSTEDHQDEQRHLFHRNGKTDHVD